MCCIKIIFHFRWYIFSFICFFSITWRSKQKHSFDLHNISDLISPCDIDLYLTLKLNSPKLFHLSSHGSLFVPLIIFFALLQTSSISVISFFEMVWPELSMRFKGGHVINLYNGIIIVYEFGALLDSMHILTAEFWSVH